MVRDPNCTAHCIRACGKHGKPLCAVKKQGGKSIQATADRKAFQNILQTELVLNERSAEDGSVSMCIKGNEDALAQDLHGQDGSSVFCCRDMKYILKKQSHAMYEDSWQKKGKKASKDLQKRIEICIILWFHGLLLLSGELYLFFLHCYRQGIGLQIVLHIG